MKQLPLRQYSLISGAIFYLLFIGLSISLANIIPPRTSGWVPDFTPVIQGFLMAVIGTIVFIFYTAKSKVKAILATILAILIIGLGLFIFIILRNGLAAVI